MVCPASVEDGEIQRGCRRPYGPRLILSHGNGFCIDAYYPFWSLLTERFDVVLHDLRNHGWNPVGDLRAHGVRAIIGDNAFVWQAIDEHFGNKPKIGVYHSVSATAAFRQLPADNGFAALVMFDPMMCPPGCNLKDLRVLRAALRRMSESARKRCNRFDSPEVLPESYRRASVFRLLRPGVADLIARRTLRPTADEAGYELRCPPDYEARIPEQYGTISEVGLGELPCPVKAIGADPAIPDSFMPTVDLSEILVLDYDFVPDRTHFLQLEEPETCVELMVEFLEAAVPEIVNS